MWDHYKKTFVRMQIVMWMAACLPVLATRSLTVGLGFLATMQIGSLLGAVLAARIRRLTEVPAGRRRPTGIEG
jgi:hypothetical protein